mmetsp:Transcript_15189/g.26340  ORF Transcript_15189/g.26340 Transcript_15189/m.26340 type:complete len:239 (+) Transcript_15189:880-1596(+)
MATCTSSSLALQWAHPFNGSTKALSYARRAKTWSFVGTGGRKKADLINIFCDSLMAAGKSNSTSRMRSPLPPVGFGNPSPGTTCLKPGVTMSVMGTDKVLLSNVCTSTKVPTRAWYNGSVTFCAKSEPLRENRACGITLSTNTTGPGTFLGVLFPSPSNTNRVPVGRPGLTSMVSVRASSKYSPASVKTLRLCVTFLRQPWCTSSNESSTVYSLFLPVFGCSFVVMASNCAAMASKAS